MMAQFRAVIFDLGGVLVPSPMEYWTKELEPSLGLPRGSVSACLLSDPVLPLFHQLEQGQLSLEDFEPLFTHFYNRQNGTKQQQQQQQQQPRIRLFSGHRDWARPHSGWEPFLQRLRAAGFRTALCTNNFFVDRASCEDTLPSNLDRTLFDVVVESCRLGIRKPDTAIFKQTLAKLGVSAEEAIFIDDLGSNLKAARAVGIHTVKCSDPSQCQVELQRLLGLDVMPEAPTGTREPTEAERLPLQPLLQYFHAKFGLESAKSDNNQNQMMHVRKFANGQSNPSYHIRLLGDGREFVLRKKPPGKLLPSAHRIEREFRVQCALKGRVPVPEMLDFVEGVLPTPFYLMQFCRGRIFQDPNLPELKEQQRTEVWLRAAQVLAQIHSVEPARMGLADFGKRGHYFRRNLLRMEAELGQAKERNELARRVLAWLLENCPPAEEEGGGDGIVHGDFRLDNLIWFHDRLEVEAVLDWELSTLGDPLSDLANFLLPFHLPPRWDGQMLMRGVRPAANGIPRPEQLIQAYLQARADLGQPEPRANQLLAHQSALLRFGLVYVLFRNAVILHGVHARFRRGQASNAAAARQLADVPEQLLALAWAQIGQSAQPMGQQLEIATAFPLSPEMMRPAAFALYCQVRDFIAEHVMAKEHQIAEWARDERTRWTVCPVIEQLKNLARQAGLWNLFITEHLDPEAKFGGRGLSTAEYGHICELMGRCLWAPEVFNCSAPDTGNMEVLIKYGSEQQRRQFLEPLLQGKVRSCFAMTEPDVASSDATNIQGSIVRDGEDHFLLNSRKWFTSGAADPRCRLCLFMGRILPVPAAEATPLHRRQSILLVPMPAPGLSVVRTLSVLDNLGDPPGGHCELLFENVRVPVANMVLGEGRGFEIAQGRLGPGRIHHCMRLLGHAERALELMRERARCRLVGGGPGGGKQPLTQKQSVRLQLAESRLALEQARLLVLKAAHLIDSRGPKAAAAEIAMIKVATPRTVLTILDRGIQLFGAAGLSQDWPLAQFFVWARALRLADGPDVVHLETVAKRELAKL